MSAATPSLQQVIRTGLISGFLVRGSVRVNIRDLERHHSKDRNIQNRAWIDSQRDDCAGATKG